MQLTIGLSPCPNDTFIFDALLNGKISTGGLAFRPVIEDVEKLNQLALQGLVDITKISFHAYTRVSDRYVLLRSGSALGRGCGPLVVTLPGAVDGRSLSRFLEENTVAIPGELTTANFLLSLFYPRVKEKIPMLFSEIEDAVVQGKAGAGLLIHENRFTYQRKGLYKAVDLGEQWEEVTGLPIPLGGICIRRDIDIKVIQQVNALIRQSVIHAFTHPEQPLPFMKRHAQTMEYEVMKQHVELYVNDFTVDIGEQGYAALAYLFKKAMELGIVPEITLPFIIDGN